jgi:hypothetical protein
MPQEFSPQTLDAEDPSLAIFPDQDFASQQHYTGPVPVLAVQEPIPVHVPLPVQVPIPAASVLPCTHKPYFPLWWDMVKLAHQVPTIQPPVPFQHQLPLFAQLQSCY